MTRLPLTGIAAFLIGLVAAHAIVLGALPEFIMSKARDRLAGSGLPVHHWQMSPLVTPQTQTIVRPSPDLAYAICLIDLSDGPVELRVPAWPEYGSLSIFDAGTDNVYAGSLDARLPGAPQHRRVRIARTGQSVEGAPGVEIVRVRKAEAVALIRRLAPSENHYDRAAALVQNSTCGPI